MKCNCVEWLLRRIFRLYSRFLCRFPLCVIFSSLFLACGLGFGIYFMDFQSGAEFLFSPITSRAKDEREVLNNLFPVDDQNTLPNRLIYLSHRRVAIAITCKDGGSVLRRDHVQVVLDLDKEIRSTEVYSDSSTIPFNFTRLCNQWNGECFPDPVTLSLRHHNDNGTVVTLPFPKVTMPSGATYDISPQFGGRVIEDDEMTSADALLLAYSLQSSPDDVDMLSADWEKSVSDLLRNFDSELIEVYGFTSASLDESQENLALAAIPYLAAAYGILILFAVISCIMIRDGTQSKPWLGILGVASASMAVVSSIGSLSYVGVSFNQVALSMPFIILGIGLDDMFIMISAWRKTDPSLPVKDRISGTLDDAAVSITITSVTDIMAFCVGSISPIPAIRIFCLYTGVAVAFDYLYQITFFAACMVLFGHMEYFDCNGFTCVPISDKVDAYDADKHLSTISNGQTIHRENGTGHGLPSMSRHADAYEATEPTRDRDELEQQGAEKPFKRHLMMIFFRDYYSKLIYQPISMVVICLSYLVYLAAAVYFFTTLEMGLEQANIAEEGTMTHGYFKLLGQYFKETGPSVSIAFTEPYPYWETSAQEKIEQFMEDIHNKSHIKPREFSEFWLDDYKRYLEFIFGTTDVGQATFVRVLREEFLELSCCERYRLDINFNGSEEISSSRLLVVSRDTFSSTDEEELLLDVRESVDEASENLGVDMISSSLGFVFAEQYIIIIPTTVLTLSIAVASMLLVSLVMMPNIVVGILVTLSVASILLGVIGFMAFWDVALESISMVNLVLCIGFSVDFSAHVAYAFVMSSDERGLSPYDKLSRSLYLLGFPILQSGFSTIIGVFLLFWSASYIFRTFAKIMTLVMTLGMLHGLVFLPVMITVSAKILQSCCGSSKRRESEWQTTKSQPVHSISGNIGVENQGLEDDVA